MQIDAYYNQLHVLKIGCSTLVLAIIKNTYLIKLNHKMYWAETKRMISYIMHILSVGFNFYFWTTSPCKKYQIYKIQIIKIIKYILF